MIPKNRVIVLGPNGMLGQIVCNYFERLGYELIKITSRYTPENRFSFINEIQQANGGWVINCIGRIKQKTNDVQDLLWANSVLPLDLVAHLRNNQILIQPSTDCVFSGHTDFPYNWDHFPDAVDDYGWSKRMGEVALIEKKNAIIIRVSIIGPDLSETPKGLLGWFLSQPTNSQLNGFINHYWNGITTLEWCKFVHQFLEQNLFDDCAGKVLQLGTQESYTKYEMLKLFQQIYQTNHQIQPFSTPEKIDRRLQPLFVNKPLDQQLEELYDFGK